MQIISLQAKAWHYFRQLYELRQNSQGSFFSFSTSWSKCDFCMRAFF
jgi:hypothetical protein